MTDLARLEEVVKVYGAVQALGPINLRLPRGAIGLLGPNGSGKTTLMRILLGLIRPTSGTLEVLGDPVDGADRAYQRRIGYAPEGDAVFPGLSGVEAVGFSGRLVGMAKAESMERAHQVLDYVELGEARYRLVEKYSTGMRQRLKLAQALVHDPELLVLDEPTEGVDPEAQFHILDLIEDLVKNHGKTLIISTHLLHDVQRLADHIVVLNQGRAVAQGTLEELRRRSSAAFLVRVNGPMEPLKQVLTQHGVSFRDVAPQLRVESDDPKAILGWIKEAGLVVRHLAPTEMTLSQAFDEAVRGGSVG